MPIVKHKCYLSVILPNPILRCGLRKLTYSDQYPASSLWKHEPLAYPIGLRLATRLRMMTDRPKTLVRVTFSIVLPSYGLGFKLSRLAYQWTQSVP